MEDPYDFKEAEDGFSAFEQSQSQVKEETVVKMEPEEEKKEEKEEKKPGRGRKKKIVPRVEIKAEKTDEIKSEGESGTGIEAEPCKPTLEGRPALVSEPAFGIGSGYSDKDKPASAPPAPSMLDLTPNKALVKEQSDITVDIHEVTKL